MKLIVSLLLLAFVSSFQINSVNQGHRILVHEESEVNTTFHVQPKFYGKYSGRKEGFLLLNEDGSGIYKYDYSFKNQGCDVQEIRIKWGFIVDESGKTVRFERPYGYSYPIIYESTTEDGFKGCTRGSLVDYLLVYKSGKITVSSSDDWVHE
ncbi:MAG TPA: hypothetical protein DDY13_01880 [Cytophagales bacterium]|jgi:hypothetical protein|nr:hypothetical protein [Cytophagales bacterium]